MENKNYDWIKPGVRAWVAGLVLPVEVEIEQIGHIRITIRCGKLWGMFNNINHLYQTEAECLEAMKKEL